MKGQKIGYIRVSTIDQNIDRQLEGIELDKKFIDKLSGKDLNRAELISMIDYVREGDTVYVHSMDRLARNLIHLKQIVINLNAKGVIINFVTENLTFTGNDSPMSNLLLSMMGAFAEFERNYMLEKQREGIKLAKIKGKFKGRKRSLTDSQIKEAKEMMANRHTVAQIAKKFKVHRTTLYYYLKEKIKD